MAEWAKIKFFWKTMLGAEGSSLSASSTLPGTAPGNIHNMLETDMWMAAPGEGPHWIALDAGEGAAAEADYLAIAGHNLFAAGAAVVLEHSDDGGSYAGVFTPFTPPSDRALVKEFTRTGAHRFWRLRIEGAAAAPYMHICAWGLKTELDYASSSFDPNAEEINGGVNLSYGGYLAGVHSRFTERSMEIRFDDADEALYSEVREWWSANGLRNFFVAWESSSHPDEVFLMRSEPRFLNPLKDGGARRDITIRLVGRKE